MAFNGESLGVWNATYIVGGTGQADVHQHWDGYTASMTTGVSVMAGIDDRPEYAEDPGDVVISWVLEIASGSGTLRLSAGLDSTRTATDPGLAAEALGDWAVVGGQTLVVAQTTLTSWSDVNYPALHPVLLVECIGGSIELDQIKLRVWPSSGVTGGWRTVPAEVKEGSAAPRRLLGYGSPGIGITGSGVELAGASPWDALVSAHAEAVADLEAKVGSTSYEYHIGSPSDLLAYGQYYQSASDPVGSSGEAQVTIYDNLGLIIADDSDYAVDPDVELPGQVIDYDPREVTWDPVSQVRGAAGQALVARDFIEWTGYVTVRYTASDSGGDGTPPFDWLGPGAVVFKAISDLTTPWHELPAVYEIVTPGSSTAIPDGGSQGEVVQDVAIPALGPRMHVVARPAGFDEPKTPLYTSSYFGTTHLFVEIGALTFSYLRGAFEYFDATYDGTDGPEHERVPGEFHFPTPDLTGEQDRIRVHFATP